MLHTRITHIAKLLFINILEWEGKKERCWPSQRILMQELSISRATLGRCLLELKNNNLIRVLKIKNNTTYETLQNSYLKKALGCLTDETQVMQDSACLCLTDETHCKASYARTNSKESKNINVFTHESENDSGTKIPKVSPQIQSLIDYYYNSPEIKKKVPAETTKTYKTIVQSAKGILNGTIINGDSALKDWREHKFTLKEIKHAIDLHKLALSEEYYPENKKHLNIHLHDFLYNPYKKGKQIKSYMTKWLADPPKKIPEYIQNVGNRGQPIIVNHIMKSQGWKKLTASDMDKLVQASMWIHDFFTDSKRRWKHGHGVLPTPGGYSKIILDIVKEKMEGKTISPGFYASNFFLKDLLPEYCHKKGLMHK